MSFSRWLVYLSIYTKQHGKSYDSSWPLIGPPKGDTDSFPDWPSWYVVAPSNLDHGL